MTRLEPPHRGDQRRVHLAAGEFLRRQVARLHEALPQRSGLRQDRAGGHGGRDVDLRACDRARRHGRQRPRHGPDLPPATERRDHLEGAQRGLELVARHGTAQPVERPGCLIGRQRRCAGAPGKVVRRRAAGLDLGLGPAAARRGQGEHVRLSRGEAARLQLQQGDQDLPPGISLRAPAPQRRELARGVEVVEHRAAAPLDGACHLARYRRIGDRRRRHPGTGENERYDSAAGWAHGHGRCGALREVM